MTTMTDLAPDDHPPDARPAAHPGRARAAKWLMTAGLLIALGISVWSMDRVHHASWEPALLGPAALGRSASTSSARCAGTRCRAAAATAAGTCGSTPSPSCSGWRPRRTSAPTCGACTGCRRNGMNRPSAVAEVALDRLVGALGLTAFVLVVRADAAAAGAGRRRRLAVVVLVVALVVRRVRPGLLAGRPMPPLPVLVRGIADLDGLPAHDHGHADRHRRRDG